MKLPISLILLCFASVFRNTVALPGHSLRPGGSSHLNAVRNAARSHLAKKPHYGSMSRISSKNGTSHVLHGSHASGMKSYSSHAISTPVAPYRLPSPSPSKSRYLHKRNSSLAHGQHSPSWNSSPHLHSANSSTASRTVSGAGEAHSIGSTKTTTTPKRSPRNTAPTPAPTAPGSPDTTVHINDESDFALLLPGRPGELISDAEADGVSYCASGGCSRTLATGFIAAAALSRAPDNSWIQVTGCIDPSRAGLDPSDDGGQFDVRFPNGAQCTFGGYGASFIEQVEPSARRFCLRCCSRADDQINCNSHQDRAGCAVAIPGTYDFPDKGVSCG